jgi:hypothetical protein
MLYVFEHPETGTRLAINGADMAVALDQLWKLATRPTEWHISFRLGPAGAPPLFADPKARTLKEDVDKWGRRLSEAAEALDAAKMAGDANGVATADGVLALTAADAEAATGRPATTLLRRHCQSKGTESWPA